MELIRLNIISVAALLTAVGAILSFIIKAVRPVRERSISWARKALKIVDIKNEMNEINKQMSDQFDEMRAGAERHASAQQREYEIITSQNQGLEDGISALLKSMDDIV